jgi:hypothetical protein
MYKKHEHFFIKPNHFLETWNMTEGESHYIMHESNEPHLMKDWAESDLHNNKKLGEADCEPHDLITFHCNQLQKAEIMVFRLIIMSSLTLTHTNFSNTKH